MNHNYVICMFESLCWSGLVSTCKKKLIAFSQELCNKIGIICFMYVGTTCVLCEICTLKSPHCLQNLNVGVAGSEVVGLIPLAPLLMAAEYYMAKENLFILHEHQKIRLVVDRLGLNSISQFKPQEKIIEYVTVLLVIVQTNHTGREVRDWS